MHDDEDSPDEGSQGAESPIHEPRLWRERGWTAQVLKNDSDDGWAVAMYQAGQAEPALVGPWTMGRDKKNPKPLDGNAFRTLVKTASEVLRRHEQALQASLHKQVIISLESGRITVALDIVPDEDSPTATLSAQDEAGEELARIPVSPAFRLDRASALAWIEGGFQRLR
jgi:hypothetical protein